MPRRTSPEASVTLHHHRLARDASKARREASQYPIAQKPIIGETQIVDAEEVSQGESSRRASSGESQNTGKSDPQQWYDRSNKNPAAEFGANAMDGE